MSQSTNDALFIDSLLRQAQVTLTADDRQALIDMYPRLRELLERTRSLDARGFLPQPAYPIQPDIQSGGEPPVGDAQAEVNE